MKSELIELIGKAGKRKAESFRHQLSVFLICLAISLFLWFLVRLSRDYNISMKYSLEFRNIPSGYRLTGASDSVIDLNVRIQGFDYFSEKYFRKETDKLEISLRNVRIRQTDDMLKGYLLTKNLSRNIAEQTNYGNDAFSISPDTIFFLFEKRGNYRKINAGAEENQIRHIDKKKDTIILIRNKNEKSIR